MSEIDRIERVFRGLEDLLREGRFTRADLDFMEAFLERSLEGCGR